MLGATLALAVVLGASPPPDPSDLVMQLGSPRFSLREAAESGLARIGREALPALRAAKDSKDPEIRLRVATLLAKIESSLLVQATPIALDFRDVPVAEAIRSINEQAKLGLLLTTEDNADIGGRRLTLRAPEALPFWKAIDALCEAGQVHYRPGVPTPIGQREGTFLLAEGPSPSTVPTADSGPFRVQLTSVHYQSEVDLTRPRTGQIVSTSPPPAPGRPGPPSNKQFYLQLLMLAEPRLAITRNGAIKLNTAVDDQGQSLLPRPDAEPSRHSAGYFGMNPAPMMRLRLDLACLERPGQQIRLIQGTVPVLVATRKPDPLEITIAGSVGRSFHNEEASLTLRDYRPAQKTQPPTIELAIKPNGPAIAPIDLGEGEPLAYRPDSPQQQVEILDDRGRVLPWFPSGTFYNGEETRLTLTLISRGIPPVPAKIRYHGIIRGATEVPFEFREVPMP